MVFSDNARLSPITQNINVCRPCRALPPITPHSAAVTARWHWNPVPAWSLGLVAQVHLGGAGIVLRAHAPALRRAYQPRGARGDGPISQEGRGETGLSTRWAAWTNRFSRQGIHARTRVTAGRVLAGRYSAVLSDWHEAIKARPPGGTQALDARAGPEAVLLDWAAQTAAIKTVRAVTSLGHAVLKSCACQTKPSRARDGLAAAAQPPRARLVRGRLPDALSSGR